MGTVIEDKQREGSLEGKIGGGKRREILVLGVPFRFKGLVSDSYSFLLKGN